jgi:hypothetical protein
LTPDQLGGDAQDEQGERREQHIDRRPPTRLGQRDAEVRLADRNRR